MVIAVVLLCGCGCGLVHGRGYGNDLVGGEFFVGGVSHGDQTCDRGSMEQKLAWLNSTSEVAAEMEGHWP